MISGNRKKIQRAIAVILAVTMVVAMLISMFGAFILPLFG